MTDKQLTALRKAGVWPEMLDYDTDGVFCWHEYQQWAVLPHSAAEALLIVEMFDALPDEWIVYRRTVCGVGRMNPNTGKCEPAVRVWCVKDMLASLSRSEGLTFENADKFHALFSALVAAGIVKETP